MPLAREPTVLQNKCCVVFDFSTKRCVLLLASLDAQNSKIHGLYGGGATNPPIPSHVGRAQQPHYLSHGDLGTFVRVTVYFTQLTRPMHFEAMHAEYLCCVLYFSIE